jgi:hypothetical protein
MGVLIVTDPNTDSFYCDVEIRTYNSSISIANSVMYALNQTAVILNITPPYGTIQGGIVVNISGYNLGSNITVLIDDIQCQIIQSTS